MYNNSYYNPMQRYQPMQMNNQAMPVQSYIPPIQQPTQSIGLLGKVVDSIDVVKAMDIPLDGSVSYFPLTDGTAIVSKQLQNDGTSKTVVYKPLQEESKELPKYITIEDVRKELEKIDLSEIEDIKEELKELKKEFKNIKKTKED